MDIRISARFRNNTAPIAEFSKETGLKFSLKKWMKRKIEPKGFFMATTGDTKVASVAEAIAVVARLYDGILASSSLKSMISEGKAKGEVWVVSFGKRCELKNEISKALMEKIQLSKVSLYVENYPLKENANPHGYFLVHFEQQV